MTLLRAVEDADRAFMPSHIALIAALVAAASGYAVVRTGRTLIHNGETLANGGGWVALILAETMISLGAAAFAISA